jgi:UDP-GlcNAc:undecaprenyl-phosphate/decaprenyl-phosphate GlcNAc-1-phosphate transferase
MAYQFYIIFAVPLILGLAITPAVIRFATLIGALDQPNERKIHKLPTPRLGGIAIYISFFLALVFSLFLNPTLHVFSYMVPHDALMLVLSLTIVLVLGIVDDLRPLRPGQKFLGQFIAATIVYLAGFRISSITHPFMADALNLRFLDYPVTLLWIVGITNAFNLIDGLDGLASGVAFIVSLTIFAISYLTGAPFIAMIALILAGAVLGFLPYNFNGARIFLGDSGSLFIGFTLAILSIKSSTKGSTAFSMIIPVLALGLPIMDTLLSMTRRFLKSLFPNPHKSESFLRKMLTMFLPDRGHIHHQLLARGLSHRTAVLLLYLVSCAFGIGAFAVTMSNNIVASGILVIIGIATLIGVSQLRYKEMAVLRNGVLLPLYERPLMHSSFFHGFLDLAFIIIAYCTSYFLTIRTGMVFEFDKPFFRYLTMICGVQLAVFYFGGMYKGMMQQLGIGDVLRMLKTTVIAVAVTWIAVPFILQGLGIHHNTTLIILDFYILLSLVIGARVSFHILNFLSRKEKRSGGRNVLIYGADTKGIAILQQILNDEAIHLNPVGFLDDNPQLEGKRLNGYPIFGSHWKLPRAARTTRIDEVIIANDIVPPEILGRLCKVSRAHGITLRMYRVKLEEVQVSSVNMSELQERFAFVNK